MRTLSLLVTLAVAAVGFGCERSDPPKTPVAKPATSHAALPASEPAAKAVKWIKTEEFPRTAVAVAEADSRAQSATPWLFQDVDPQVFADGRGGYRVAWMKKDPRRNSIGYAWYELDPAQHLVGGSSQIPSHLTALDITQAPDWNSQPATSPSPSATEQEKGPGIK